MSPLLSVLVRSLLRLEGLQCGLAVGCGVASYLFFWMEGRTPAVPLNQAVRDVMGLAGICFAVLGLFQLSIFVEHFRLASQIKKLQGPPG